MRGTTRGAPWRRPVSRVTHTSSPHTTRSDNPTTTHQPHTNHNRLGPPRRRHLHPELRRAHPPLPQVGRGLLQRRCVRICVFTQKEWSHTQTRANRRNRKSEIGVYTRTYTPHYQHHKITNRRGHWRREEGCRHGPPRPDQDGRGQADHRQAQGRREAGGGQGGGQGRRQGRGGCDARPQEEVWVVLRAFLGCEPSAVV